MPTDGQIFLLMTAVLCFLIGGALSILRLRFPSDALRVASKSCLYFGIVFCVGVLVWHARTRHNWVPAGDNFDSLIWLGALISLFVVYMQETQKIRGIDWFLMPIVMLLLVMAAVFGRVDYHEYVAGTWAWVHRVTSYGGTVAFALAAGASIHYVIVVRKLRHKQFTGPNFGSLEKLENLTRTNVLLGFALLTVGLVTGIIQMLGSNRAAVTSKIVFACGAWLVYAIVLHAPINPSFRGRRTAFLSMFGFALIIGAIFALMVLPGAGGAK